MKKNKNFYQWVDNISGFSGGVFAINEDAARKQVFRAFGLKNISLKIT